MPDPSESPPSNRIEIGGVSIVPPEGWTLHRERGQAEFRLPGDGSEVDAKLVLSGYSQGPINYFKQHELGHWCDQYEQPDGRSPREVARIETRTIGLLKVTSVELTGTRILARYDPYSLFKPPDEHCLSPGEGFFGAILERSAFSSFGLKLTGPESVVTQRKPSVEAFIASARPIEGDGNETITDQHVEVGGLQFAVPAGWIEVRSRRPPWKGAIFFWVPSSEGSERQAEVRVTHYRSKTTRPLDLELECWRYDQPDGRSSREVAIQDTRTIDGMEVQSLDLAGNLPPHPWMPAPHTPDQAVAIRSVDSPCGQVRFTMEGDREVVEQWKSTIDDAIRSIRPVERPSPPEPGEEAQPETKPYRAPELQSGERVDLGGVTAVIPEGWILDPPADETLGVMPLGQFRLAGDDADSDAELVITRPARGRLRGREITSEGIFDNLSWRYEASDGHPAVAQIETRIVAGLKVSIATISGTKVLPFSPERVPGQSLVYAIVEAPARRLGFILKGSTATVQEWRGSFEELIESIRPSAMR